jgi:hypothetical protein
MLPMFLFSALSKQMQGPTNVDGNFYWLMVSQVESRSTKGKKNTNLQ